MADLKPGLIVDFDYIDARRGELGRIVCTSGGFDPIHPGHMSCIAASKLYGDTVVVIVNGDAFLTNKKGRPFQDVKTRCQIVAHSIGADLVVPFTASEPDDQTVIEALRRLKPHVFTKGGDRRDAASIPEYETCRELAIELITGVGYDKQWSSSDFLKEWGEYYRGKDNEAV